MEKFVRPFSVYDYLLFLYLGTDFHFGFMKMCDYEDLILNIEFNSL